MRNHKQKLDSNIYDVIVIGTGPAGLTASIYTTRYFLKTLIVGKVLGGTMALAHKIENYPGFLSISGVELSNKIKEQIEKLGTKIIFKNVVSIKKEKINQEHDFIFKVFLEDVGESPLLCNSIILASGTEHRSLAVSGEKEFLGKGVSYCATCDAAFFRNRTVVVVGGGNAATMAALHLSEYAKNVYLVYRGDVLKGEPIWNERALKNSKIKVIFKTNLKAIFGKQVVEKVVLDREFQGSRELKTDGVFIEIGQTPTVSIAKELGIEMDEKSFIKIDSQAKTNVAGVFSAGDITNGSGGFRQIITAASEGAIAGKSAFDFKIERSKRLK